MSVTHVSSSGPSGINQKYKSWCGFIQANQLPQGYCGFCSISIKAYGADGGETDIDGDLSKYTPGAISLFGVYLDTRIHTSKMNR